MVRVILTIQILALNSSLVNAFGSFQMPKIQMPWDNANDDTTKEVESPANSKALKPGDTIAVIGASGNVGKLVSLRLSDTYNVNGVVRDASSVEAFFDGRDQIKLFEADLLDE
eukprot:237503_1